jgi:hypothetical protein
MVYSDGITLTLHDVKNSNFIPNAEMTISITSISILTVLPY